VIEEAVGRGVSIRSVGSAYRIHRGAEDGPGLSKAGQETVGDLVRMLSAIDESDVPEIHNLAATLTRERSQGGSSGLA
jgi:hypothetical protein